MTGPEHYKEGERLIAWAKDLDADRARDVIADAQVHATLAAAAATAMSAGVAGAGMDRLDYQAWDDVAGVHDADEDDGSDPAAYPAPGSEIPSQPGYVVGTCGHRVAGSEWRAGLRTCERCPDDEQDGGTER